MNAKWISIGVVGSLFAASHIGMIGMLATRNGSKLPELNMPVGPYTSYVATADEDGYKISYSANDPKTMHITKDIVRPSGFLGFGRTKTQVTEEYVMDGATNQGVNKVLPHVHEITPNEVSSDASLLKEVTLSWPESGLP